jgi:REP element-mobilizing transposase RayT
MPAEVVRAFRLTRCRRQAWPKRRSIRLPTHDYSTGGCYFVTICAHQREALFGQVVGGEMRCNVLGDIVAEAWHGLAERYGWVVLDAWIVMPNHFHGVLTIEGIDGTPGFDDRKSLGQLIGEMKTVSTRTINAMRSSAGSPVWQRNYYEHVIRGERSLDAIRAYLQANPANWQRDPEYCPDTP